MASSPSTAVLLTLVAISFVVFTYEMCREQAGWMRVQSITHETSDIHDVQRVAGTGPNPRQRNITIVGALLTTRRPRVRYNEMESRFMQCFSPGHQHRSDGGDSGICEHMADLCQSASWALQARSVADTMQRMRPSWRVNVVLIVDQSAGGIVREGFQRLLGENVVVTEVSSALLSAMEASALDLELEDNGETHQEPFHEMVGLRQNVARGPPRRRLLTACDRLPILHSLTESMWSTITGVFPVLFGPHTDVLACAAIQQSG